MDRDLGKPQTSQTSLGNSASLVQTPTGLPMKQTHPRLPGTRLRMTASSKALDKDGTFNKEFDR
jgi:hypothetical protein